MHLPLSYNLRFILIILSVFVSSYCCMSQKLTNEVRLSKWSSEACDNTFDPYRLKTRVTNIEYTDTTTIFTVNFSDNCCATFKPAIRFYNNKLVFLPYEEYTGDYCTCNCCFTIRYEVFGLKEKKYSLYFNDKKIVLSDDFYDTVKPSFQYYNGKKINSINKYGFKEGLWVTFYKNGHEKEVSLYPEQSMYFEPKTIWSKGYHPNGNLSFYDRNDTSEAWFEDKELKYQFIEFKVDDTLYTKLLKKFDNKVVETEFLLKGYQTLKNGLQSDYAEGWQTETIYKRKYFKSGKPQSILGVDTSYTWFETGQVESKRYKSGMVKFDTKGQIVEQGFNWVERVPEFYIDLQNSLDVLFDSNNTIREISLNRDETTLGGVTGGNRYYWKWDAKKNLIESPKNWNEALPWERFNEMQVYFKKDRG